MDEDVPLVVPEVNKEIIKNFKTIASPNCVVIPVAIFLHAVGVEDIEFVNITTYQSVSGAGKQAMAAFFKEIKSSYMKPVQNGMFYDEPMAFNIIPAIGKLDEDGNCDEEIKINQELHKIFKQNKTMQIIATTMRVPVTIGHLISLTFKTTKQLTHQEILKKMNAIGINYNEKICTPLMAAKENTVFACRLRNHLHNQEASYFWSVVLICDNLRKGGALNAWQIAKEMIGEPL
jgi:aspartate-semialdehyde dehydrogenase